MNDMLKNTNKYNKITSSDLINELKSYLEDGEVDKKVVLQRMQEPYNRIMTPNIESAEAAICCAKIAIDQYLLQKSIDSVGFQIKED